MKVKVLGKAHREGISNRTGKPYNINVLHCVGAARDVEGQAVLTITINGMEHPYDKLSVGGEYIAEYDSTGTLLDFRVVAGGATH